ncbi:hypothetical protein PS2_037088 [Malus domestica]
MPQLIEESSRKCEFTTADKPPFYRPTPLANKEQGAKWRKSEPRKKAFAGNDCSPKCETPHIPPNNIANQQLRKKLAELRIMVLQNAQPQACPLFRITY